MKPGGGKQKGAAFERQVCKELSLWLTNKQKEDVLWRSAMSGGRATQGLKTGKQLANVSGDICATGTEGIRFTSKFFVECKSYKDLKLQSLFLSPGASLFLKIWDKLEFEAGIYKKHPLLIAKQNNAPGLAVTDSAGFKALFDKSYTPFCTYWFPELFFFLYKDIYAYSDFNLRPPLNGKRKGQL